MSELWSKMYYVLQLKYLLFLSNFNKIRNVLDRFSKNPKRI
jgi:hypothetical protein